MQDMERYRKDNQSGASETVLFKVKPHHKEALREVSDLLGEEYNMSDAVRFMVLPYLDAFEKAKNGKYWEGAITMTKGYSRLGDLLKAQQREVAQATMNFEEAPA